MALREADTDRMWQKLGFEILSGKHVQAILRVGGKIVARTYRSHGRGKLDGDIPRFIRQQMFLNSAQFEDAYNCPLKAPGYLKILSEKGLLPPKVPKT